MALRRNTEAELDALSAVCERLAGFDDRVSVEWLDGYLSVLAAGPRVPELTEALPLMFDDSWARTFADPDDEAKALAVLQARWRVLKSQLDPERLWDEPDALHLAPVLLEPAPGAPDTLGDDWRRGLLDALSQPAWGWVAADASDDDDYRLALQRLQGLPAPGAAAPEAPSRESLVDEACFALQDLRLWWMAHAPRTPPRRVEPVPGRNDPCPCGSGRKYKKCHGAA